MVLLLGADTITKSSTPSLAMRWKMDTIFCYLIPFVVLLPTVTRKEERRRERDCTESIIERNRRTKRVTESRKEKERKREKQSKREKQKQKEDI